MHDELTTEQMRYQNNNYRQWLESPNTQMALKRLKAQCRIPSLSGVQSQDALAWFNAQCANASGFQTAIDFIETVPYPMTED